MLLIIVVINQTLTQEPTPFQCWVKWPLLVSFPMTLQNVVGSFGLRFSRHIQAIIVSLPFLTHHSQFFPGFPHFVICPGHLWPALFSAVSSLGCPCLLPFIQNGLIRVYLLDLRWWFNQNCILSHGVSQWYNRWSGQTCSLPVEGPDPFLHFCCSLVSAY